MKKVMGFIKRDPAYQKLDIKGGRDMKLKLLSYKGVFFVFVFFSLLFFPFNMQAGYQTNLLTGVYIQDGLFDLDAGNWSAPTVYDWDSDGLKDLIIGRKGLDGIGYVSWYRNYGTDSAPLFNGYSDIQSCSIPCTNAGG